MAAEVDEGAEVHKAPCTLAVFYSSTLPPTPFLAIAQVDEGAKLQEAPCTLAVFYSGYLLWAEVDSRSRQP